MTIRPTLGLHTREEQDVALAKARSVFEQARTRVLGDDREEANNAYQFGLGYLSAIAELADAEGAPGLATGVREMMSELMVHAQRWAWFVSR